MSLNFLVLGLRAVAETPGIRQESATNHQILAVSCARGGQKLNFSTFQLLDLGLEIFGLNFLAVESQLFGFGAPRRRRNARDPPRIGQNRADFLCFACSRRSGAQLFNFCISGSRFLAGLGAGAGSGSCHDAHARIHAHAHADARTQARTHTHTVCIVV